MNEHLSRSLTSIIVLTYNNLHYTRQCLDSIYMHTPPEPFELILVDNASQDETPHYLQEFAAQKSNCQLILNTENTGFPAANNQGAALARGDYIVFLNNDTIVTPGWLPGLLKYLDDPQVGMVGPVTNESGNETRIRTDYVSPEDMLGFAAEYTANHPGEAFEIQTLPFLCAALRRETFEAIGPLDERFGVGMFEDDDYAMRLHQAGYKIFCAEDVFIHHWGSAAFSQAGFVRYWNTFTQNLRKFEQKWDVTWQPNRYRDEYLDEQIRILWDRKRSLALRVIDLETELDQVHQSLTWRLLMFIRGIAQRFAPKGSRRAQALDQIAHFLRELVAKISAFLKKWVGIYRNQKLSYQIKITRRRMGQKLEAVIKKHDHAREIVVFIPTIPWKTALFQRPHQLARALAKQNCLVFFCEPPDSSDYVGQFAELDKNLFIVGPVPLEIFKQIPSPVVFCLPYNRDDLANFTNPRVVYEYIDDLSVFHGGPKVLKRNHDALVQESAVVLATAENLYDEIQPLRPDALLNPNAADVPFIRDGVAKTESPPDDLQKLVQRGKPIAGYYGALAHWFDYRLLKRVAALCPDWDFVLIGLDYDGSVNRSRVVEVANIHWLGPKPYPQIPSYLKYFDVAIIPFRLNEVTHATSPLKLFEYMAGGKPIITTAMHECQKYPPVLIAADAADFALKLPEALALRADQTYQHSLADWAEKNTWEQRTTEILAALPAAHPGGVNV